MGTVIGAVYRAFLAVDDSVDISGLAVRMFRTMRGWGALTGIFTSHLAPVVAYLNVLVPDCAVLVRRWATVLRGAFAV